MVESLLQTITTRQLVASAGDSIPTEPSGGPSAAPSLTYSDESDDQEEPIRQVQQRQRRASTRLIAQNAQDIQRITGETTAEFVGRCCGGGCCLVGGKRREGVEYQYVTLPDNDAFKSLGLKIEDELPVNLTNITELPENTVSFKPIPRPISGPALSPSDSGISMGPDGESSNSSTAPLEKAARSLSLDNIDTAIQPPKFVQPHPPYNVYAAKIHSARELTKVGAEKRTYHFDLDVTNYPDEESNRSEEHTSELQSHS